MKSKILILLLFTLLPHSIAAQGLQFEGLARSIDERTSLRLFGKRPLQVRDSLKIEFDALLRPDDYGYILQVNIRDRYRNESPINLLYDCRANVDFCSFKIVLESRKLLARLDIPATEFKEGWHHFDCRLDLVRDSLFMSIDGAYHTSGGAAFVSTMKADITFGRSKSQIDVADFSLRNLRISEKKRSYFYPLNEDSGNYAFCGNFRYAATVTNPIWMKNDFRLWRRFHSHKSPSYQTIAYDTLNHRLYDMVADSLILKGLRGEPQVHSLASRAPVYPTMGTSLVDPRSGRVICYEFYARDAFRLNDCSLATLDPSTLEWEPLLRGFSGNPRMRNTVIFDREKNRLVGFGGYGAFSYCGDFYAFPLEGGTGWAMLPPVGGEGLYPRFQHASAFDEESREMYIFGGVGSVNGEQILGRHQYTLHKVNIDTMESALLWEIDWQEEDKVPVANMILDGEGHFYTLMYTESATLSKLKLYRFSLEDGTYTTFADDIPMYSDRITCQANLFYDREMSVLVATVEESPDDIASVTSAYALSYPPVPQGIRTVDMLRRRAAILILALILLALLLAAAAVLVVRHLRRRAVSRREILTPAVRPDSIYLFGDFAAYASDGSEITPEFYAKLRQITAILLSRSRRRGMSTQSLTDTFWPDREESKAKNIRGVTLNNLRKVLSKMKGITLRFTEGRYNFEYDGNFYCDYLEVMSLLSTGSADNSRLLALLSRGPFLGSENDPVLDDLKNETEGLLVPVLEREIERLHLLGYNREVLLCARILTDIDFINEAALKYSIVALNRMDRKEEARKRYKAFAQRYFDDYRQEYSCSYERILSENE